MAIEYELREGIVWEMIASAEQGNTWRPVASITGLLAVRDTIRRLMGSESDLGPMNTEARAIAEDTNTVLGVALEYAHVLARPDNETYTLTGAEVRRFVNALADLTNQVRAAERERDLLRKRCERLSAPVSDEEMQKFALHWMKLGTLNQINDHPVLTSTQVNALIAARMEAKP